MTTQGKSAPSAQTKTGSGGSPGVMLALATIGFALNFWAWALLSPLGPKLRDNLHLTSFQQALVVAVPVIVGALGRIPVGALTDRLGGRVMFPAVSFVTIVPVLYIGLSGHTSLAGLLVGGFFLGVAGTAFAVGVPFVNAWFGPNRRGTAIGVFGAGMGGTAISALTTVKLATGHGFAAPFVLTAIVLAVYGVVAWLLLRDAPGRLLPTERVTTRLAAALRTPITWEASALYALTFGGYVAFSVYLPTYLKSGYGLAQADAANRMAGFVLVAVVMRPVGGWLSDRFSPVPVLVGVLSVVAIGASVQAATPTLVPAGTIAFLSMAAALGAGAGAVFALVAMRSPAGMVGAVTGLVGAAGGLGGFVPPLLMGRPGTARCGRARDAPVRGDGRPAAGRGARVSSPQRSPAGASPPGTDGPGADALLRLGRFFRRDAEVSPDLRALEHVGGREGDVFYRDRWSHDKVVRSTHGVNCTGSCSWKVYVKDGIITWESQQTDYPSVGPDSPEYEPRGCPRGAAFSWYTYSRRPGSVTRCLPGRTSSVTRPDGAATSRPAARAATYACGGTRPSRSSRPPTCTPSVRTARTASSASRRSRRCRWCRTRSARASSSCWAA